MIIGKINVLDTNKKLYECLKLKVLQNWKMTRKIKISFLTILNFYFYFNSYKVLTV